MEISEELRKRRGRKRKLARDETGATQISAFPSENNRSVAETVEQDNSEKERTAKAIAAVPEIFTPEQVEWVFDVYVGIVAFAYSLILKVEFKEISDELKFEDDQKKALAVPLAKILSKHAPAEWAANTAEIQLITMMGIWTVTSFKRAKNVQQLIAEEKKNTERTNPVAPMRREPAREIHVPV